MILAEEATASTTTCSRRRPELAKDPRVQTLYELLTSEEMDEFLAEEYQGFIIPVE